MTTNGNLIGKTLRGYQLTGLIGSGGFGAVYLAKQQAVGREVAVKVILPQYANTPHFVRRFEAEAQYIARLEHPHIVPLFDYWRDPQGAYLVMRYVRGGSMSHILKQRTFILDEVERFLDEITGALAVAHRGGVVHLDLKPDNILFDDDYNAYLTDFGIAKGASGDDGDDRHISGTIAYAAPEQIQGYAPTPQVDIYSLGLILYEMLAKEHAYVGHSFTELIMAQLDKPVPPLIHVRPDLPLLFNDIIQRATDKNPNNRYTDVRQIADDFKRARRQQLIGATQEVPAIDLHNVRNPYKGLRPFDEADAGDFFGRDELLAQLLGYLSSSMFLAVVGPSGSGKSSLLKAGLLPAVRRGAVSGSRNWFVTDFVPGGDPLGNLAEALTGLATRNLPYLAQTLAASTDGLTRVVRDILRDAPDGEVLLLIDQFEELFTQTEHESVRKHFLALIRAAVRDPSNRLRVVIGLRADFYDRPLQYEGFGALLQANTQVVLPLSDDELEQVIIGPLEPLGMGADADLIATIIADVRQEPGALPLLQYALTEVFERRNGARLTLAAYRSSGGVSGAIAKRAEDVFTRLSENRQLVAKQVFLRLVTLGEGNEDTRRRALYSEIWTLNTAERVGAVLDIFSKYRLITFDIDPTTREPVIELAHEALLRTWRRLIGWLGQSRDDIRQQRLLNNAAQEWIKSAYDPSFLLSGSRLEQAEAWLSTSNLRLAQDEQRYVAASVEERERIIEFEVARAEEEIQIRARARFRLRLLIVMLSVSVVFMMFLAGYAFSQSQQLVGALATSEHNALNAQAQSTVAAYARNDAETQRQNAEAEAVRARSLALSNAAQLAALDGDRDTAVTLGLAATENNPDPPRSSLVMLSQLAHDIGTYRLLDMGASVDAVAVSDNGEWVVAGSRLGEMALWDTERGDIVQLFDGHTERVSALAFAPDGETVLSASWDNTAVLWDMDSGERLVTFVGHEGNVTAVAFNADGTQIATASIDGTVRLWDKQGSLRRVYRGHGGPVYAVAFGDGGRFVLSGGTGDAVHLWSVDSGQLASRYRGHASRVNAVGFLTDNTLFSASEDGGLRLYSTLYPAPLATFSHDGRLTDARSFGDGQTVLTAQRNGQLTLWDIDEGIVRETFDEHRPDAALSVAWSADGRIAASGGGDGRVRVWMMAPNDPRETIPINLYSLPLFAAYPDENLWAVGSERDALRLYRTGGNYARPSELRILPPLIDVNNLTFSPDGRYLAVASGEIVYLWDVIDGELLHVLNAVHRGDVHALAFTPDSTRLLSGCENGTLSVWNVTSGENIATFTRVSNGVDAIAVHPMGGIAVTAGRSGTMTVWNLRSLEADGALGGSYLPVTALAFAPDGTLFSGHRDGTLRAWDVDARQMRYDERQHVAAIRALSVASDGHTLLSGGDDGLVWWDVDGRYVLYRWDTSPVIDMHLIDDEQAALVGFGDGRIVLYDMVSLDGVADWLREHRYVAPLTCAQRDLFNIDPPCDSATG